MSFSAVGLQNLPPHRHVAGIQQDFESQQTATGKAPWVTRRRAPCTAFLWPLGAYSSQPEWGHVPHITQPHVLHSLLGV